MRKIILSLLLTFIISESQAAVIELSPAETRFVAMRADKVNARSGPNIRYPIEWIYQQQNYPVEIIAEYEQWRKIKDYDGTVTWVRKNLLTIIGISLGTIAGFLYWKFVGCNTGTCAITSNPINSTLYGSVMGGLVFSMFKKDKKEENDISRNH